MDEKKIIRRLSAVGISGNVFLFAFKLFAGITGHSSAMVSDAVHSLADVFASFVAMIGVRLSRKAPDVEHPYGHERFECLASLILGTILAGTGFGIALSGVRNLLAGSDALAAPAAIALAAAIVSVLTKETMFRYTRYHARKLNSSAFMADAWHHRSDALASVGSLIGVGGSMLGYRFLDPAACVIICLCILKAAYDILKDAVSQLMDTSCGSEYEQQLSRFIAAQPGVERLDVLHTRKFGGKIYIDAEIAVNGTLPLEKAHEVAEQVHDAVESAFPDTKHIMIHENPSIQRKN